MGGGGSVLLDIRNFLAHRKRLVKSAAWFAIAFALVALFELVGGKKPEMIFPATVIAALKFRRKNLATLHADHEVESMMFPPRNFFWCFHTTWIENVLAVRVNLPFYAQVAINEGNVSVKRETTAVHLVEVAPVMNHVSPSLPETRNNE